jgi:hypothetical protein
MPAYDLPRSSQIVMAGVPTRPAIARKRHVANACGKIIDHAGRAAGNAGRMDEAQASGKIVRRLAVNLLTRSIAIFCVARQLRLET